MATAPLTPTVTLDRAISCSRSAVPINSFDVIIHAHAEALAPLRAPIFYNAPSTFAFHPRAKTVHAKTAAYFGLVCSLRHPIVLLKKPGHTALGNLLENMELFRALPEFSTPSLTVNTGGNQEGCTSVERRRIIT